MATITTTTSDSITDPGMGRTDVQDDGTMWHMVRRTSGVIGFFYSKNNGSTWIDSGAGNDVTASGNLELSNFYIDAGNYASWCYRTYGGGQDRINLVYGGPNAARTGWSWKPTTTPIVRDAASAGQSIQKIDVVTTTNPYSSGGPALTVIAAHGGSNIPHVLNVGWWTNNFGVLAQKGLYSFDTLSNTVNCPSLDFRHTGDDKTKSNPMEFLVVAGSGWTNQNLGTYQMFRFLWDGSKFQQSVQSIIGSNGQLDSGLGGAPLSQVRRVVRVDAQGRALIPHINGTDSMAVLEFDVSRTVRTIRTPSAHPTGIVTSATLNYDSNGNVYLYAVGTSTNQVYVCTYTRNANSWSGWTTVGSATFDNGSWGARRNASNNRLDTWTQTGSGTYTIASQQSGIAASPLAPNWVTSTTLAGNTGSQITTGGLVANVASALPLDWTFIDPDPTDSQSAYAISRQIGAGTLAYFRASDNTWQAAEVKNVSATSAATVPSSWGADSDANHTYKVRVWDSSDLASVYSSGLVITPSAVVNPTITAPSGGGTITTSTTTLTWTVSQQTKYRVVLERDVSGTWVPVSDAAVQQAADRSYNITGLLNGNSYRITLYTFNNEGLMSTGVQVSFSVVYTPPNTPTITFSSLGAMFDYVIHGTISNPAGGISVVSNDVERRTGTDDDTIILFASGVAVNGTFNDATVKSGVSYQYRVTAYGSNGANTVGSWTS